MKDLTEDVRNMAIDQAETCIGEKVHWGGIHNILVWHCWCAFDRKKECKFAFCKFCVINMEKKGEG